MTKIRCMMVVHKILSQTYLIVEFRSENFTV